MIINAARPVEMNIYQLGCQGDYVDVCKFIIVCVVSLRTICDNSVQKQSSELNRIFNYDISILSM